MSDADTPLEFVGSAEDDLFVFPPTVKRVIGFALRAAQKGGRHRDAKPLKGFKGAGVLEVISDFDGNTFRAVYTVRLRGIIYVRYACQKKSRRGIKTPLQEMEKVRARLKDSEALHQIATEGKR